MKAQSQASAGVAEVRRPEPAKAGLRKSESQETPPESFRNSESNWRAFRTSEEAQSLAAELFVETLQDTRCGLTRDEVAFILKVSRALVDKWCEQGSTASPSFIQMLRMPVQFHYALNRAMDRRFGYGREALSDLIAAAGAIAVSLGR